MMDKSQGPLPLVTAPFSPDECKGLSMLLSGYTQFLQNAPIFPAKETQAERDRRIEILKSVAARLDQQLTANPTAIQLPLNAEEVEEIIKAMIGFVTYIQQTVPPSFKRDETLSAIDEWRLHLIGSISMHPGGDALN
jgi:hypothetical protein